LRLIYFLFSLQFLDVRQRHLIWKMLLPGIRRKIVDINEKIHLTVVSFVEVDTDDNGLTR
jgi:hypothetical protein